MSKGVEYLLTLIVVTVAAYCTVTPLATETADSLNNTAELIIDARRNR